MDIFNEDFKLPTGSVIIVKSGDPAVRTLQSIAGITVKVVDEKPYDAAAAEIMKMGYEVKYPDNFKNDFRFRYYSCYRCEIKRRGREVI